MLISLVMTKSAEMVTKKIGENQYSLRLNPSECSEW